MGKLLDSNAVHAEIDDLLLTGRATTASEAEEMFLLDHLEDMARLALELDDAAFAQHEAIKLLMSHGSRRLEDR